MFLRINPEEMLMRHVGSSVLILLLPLGVAFAQEKQEKRPPASISCTTTVKTEDCRSVHLAFLLAKDSEIAEQVEVLVADPQTFKELVERAEQEKASRAKQGEQGWIGPTAPFFGSEHGYVLLYFEPKGIINKAVVSIDAFYKTDLDTKTMKPKGPPHFDEESARDLAGRISAYCAGWWAGRIDLAATMSPAHRPK